jgi:hypothetical protein
MLGWTNAWNHIIRTVIFKDYDLRRLMKIPSKTGVIQFTERYFIKAGFTSKLLTDETCRIIYSDTLSMDTDVPNVKKNLLTFDIYVRDDDMRGVGDDGLITRMDLIVERLDHLLMQERYLADTGYRFWRAGEWDTGTRTAGYTRKTLGYYYMKVY